MDKVVTKKKVFLASGIMLALLVLLGIVGDSKICGEGDIRCMDKITNIIQILYPIFPFFLLSLITYWMHEKVFRAWLHFAYWWVPLTILLVLMSKDSSGGFGIPDILSREAVSMIFSALFLIISLILIAYKSYKLRGK